MENTIKNHKYGQSNQIVKENKNPFFSSKIIQRKMSIGAENDSYEIEADRVADRVVSMSDSEVQTTARSQTGGLIQRKCSSCEEEHVQKKSLAESITPVIQRKNTIGIGESTASSAITNQINSSKGGGRAMDKSTSNYMESRFGTDFSRVRVHTDSNAIRMSRELNAQAFTVGNDVYFNEGKYNPSDNSGKHLLAHELTHTLQQGNGGVQRKIQRKVHQGHDNNGTYSLNDESCEFDYNQNWYFQFNIPLNDSTKTSLMNRAASQVHSTWSNKHKLLPTALASFVNCPCRSTGTSVDVNINVSEGEKEGRGIQVTVLPSVRAFVNPVLNTMSLEQNDFNGHTFSTITGHQFTIAHEFGHTIDITDEYNGWAAFFVPSVQQDGSSIMNIGNQVRPRHYQYFADMLSLEILGCRYSPDGIRQPERENPVIRSMSLAGITNYQDGLSLSTPSLNLNLGSDNSIPNIDPQFGTNYDFRVSNSRLFGLFYPQIGGIKIWNPETKNQSDYGVTAGIRLGQIAHPLVFNLRTGIVMNPLDPASGVRLPINIQAGLRNENFEFGMHYTPVIDLINGNTTHLLGLGLRF